MKYARNGVPERTTGSWIADKSSERITNRRTYVANRDGEKEEKYPEVQIKSLARRSTLASNPKREEPEQAGSVERDGHIRLNAEWTSSVS